MNRRFAVPGVDANTPLNVAAPALLLAKASPLFELEEAASAGADMDAVHDMRVASRRLREAMRLLAPLYPRRAFRAWYRRVRRITRALGPVRDSDVFIDEFSRLGVGLGEGGLRAVTFMVGFRMGQRVHELDLLNRELARLNLAASRASFDRFAHLLDGAGNASRPYADFAHAAVAERAATVFGAQLTALDEVNIAEQHALRIDYKRLRYAVEAFAPCYADDFDDLHETLTAFQDALGDMHDVHVFLDMLQDPERVAAAARAGVSVDDLSEVVAVLESRAHTHFERFARLARKHPPERLLPKLLLPLARQAVIAVPPASASPSTEAAGPDAVAPGDKIVPTIADIQLAYRDEAPIVAPVVVGDEPWEDEWCGEGADLLAGV